MNILLVDCNLASHDSLTYMVQTAFPEADVKDFTDPSLALKYGINNDIDMLIMRPQMRLEISDQIVRNLRCYHQNLRVVYVSDTPLRRYEDHIELSDAIIESPVTVGKLLEADKSTLLY